MLGYICLGYGALWIVEGGGNTAFVMTDPQTMTGEFNIISSLQYQFLM